MDVWRRDVDEEEPQHRLNCTSSMLDEVERARSYTCNTTIHSLPKHWRQKNLYLSASAYEPWAVATSADWFSQYLFVISVTLI